MKQRIRSLRVMTAFCASLFLLGLLLVVHACQLTSTADDRATISDGNLNIKNPTVIAGQPASLTAIDVMMNPRHGTLGNIIAEIRTGDGHTVVGSISVPAWTFTPGMDWKKINFLPAIQLTTGQKYLLILKLDTFWQASSPGGVVVNVGNNGNYNPTYPDNIRYLNFNFKTYISGSVDASVVNPYWGQNTLNTYPWTQEFYVTSGQVVHP